MKKYLVIGNPIQHSLSPKLHNYWIKKNNLDAVYDKRQLDESKIEEIINDIKKGKIDGINVTVPFKKTVIPFLDKLAPLAEKTHSVNTIFKEGHKVVGDNTDVEGFELSLKYMDYSVKNKKIFVLGAGGVAPSIILALKRLGASEIILSNRTKKNAEFLKKEYPSLKVIDWGQTNDFDMIINATSLGLKNSDQINIDYNKFGTGKLFYDVIYSPSKTNFLLKAKESGNQIENGKLMFIYQAQLGFKIFHNILPKVDKSVINLLDI